MFDGKVLSFSTQYACGMRFEGRVYFDMGADTWHLYRFLGACARSGVDLALSWVPFAGGDSEDRPVLAAYCAVKTADPDRHGDFLQALLTARHGEGRALDGNTVAHAAAAAGVDPASTSVEAGMESLAAADAGAGALGVVAAPTLYRHGPVMQVRLNPAALEGDVVARLRLIDAALDDDGVWGLVKP